MRMTNARARQIVNEWLSATGKQRPATSHNYVDFVTEVRILTGIDPQEDVFDVWEREDACAWLRVLAHRIVDGVPVGTTLLFLESVH